MLTNRIQNELLEQVNVMILEHKAQIESSLNCIPLFGAVGGSISLNLANLGSDIDFYLVTKDKPDEILKSIMFDGNEKKEIDFMCVSLNELEEACEKYIQEEHRYPTRFFRNQKDMIEIVASGDLYRPTFKREMIMRMFMADNILEFEKESVRKYYEILKKGLKLIDIWDSQFNRAYGNYHEQIKGRENVLIRKYLYTIHEIVTCHLLMAENETVVMNFKQMLEPPYYEYVSEIAELCDALWDKNSKMSLLKNKAYMTANKKLNNWIENKLEELLQEMKLRETYLKNNYLPFGKSIILHNNLQH